VLVGLRSKTSLENKLLHILRIACLTATVGLGRVVN
jgi:hypothetical protein